MAGRVEHVVSRKAARFQSVDELMAFMTEVLREVASSLHPLLSLFGEGNGLELTRVRLPASRLRGGDALGLGQGSRRSPSVHALEGGDRA